MSLPGFFAETSVYLTLNHYRLAAGRVAGIVRPMGQVALPQLGQDDLRGDGASCGKLSGFGNVICSKCTTGPFGTRCTDYVCDKDGNNCKPTKPNLSPLLTARRGDTASELGFAR